MDGAVDLFRRTDYGDAARVGAVSIAKGRSQSLLRQAPPLQQPTLHLQLQIRRPQCPITITTSSSLELAPEAERSPPSWHPRERRFFCSNEVTTCLARRTTGVRRSSICRASTE